jgi:hypothetical protein
VLSVAGWPQAVQSCLLLGGVNLIYFLRARTEERHLSRDTSYGDYSAYIASKGVLALIFRATAPVFRRGATRMNL